MYSPSIQNYPSNSPGVFPLGLEVVSPASGAHSLPQDCPENPGKMGRSPASRRFVWKLFVIIFPLCSLVEWPFEGIAANSPISDTHTPIWWNSWWLSNNIQQTWRFAASNMFGCEFHPGRLNMFGVPFYQMWNENRAYTSTLGYNLI